MKRISFAIFFVAAGVVAQTPPAAPVPPGNFFQQSVNRTYWATGIAGGAVVKNAPYSADAVTETTQTLGDGNRIVQRTTQKLYRDSDGRERREESLLALGQLAQPDGLRLITISDPVAQTAYTLDPQIRTARQTAVVGLYQNVTAAYTLSLLGAGRGRGAGSAQPVKEDLGTKNVEGVNAQGSRSTETIPAGQIGNQFPIKIVDEVWYSPELQMNVTTSHNDPRTGEVVYKLMNISRVNPAKSLFEVPSDYTIQTGPPAGGRGGGRGTPGGRSATPFGTQQK